jgi:hypothetical protein
MAVGSSAEHTPIKHALLKICSGMVAGAASKIPWLDEFMAIDCCAGSAAASIHSGKSSPEILCEDLNWASLHGLKATGYFIEKHPHTVGLLRKNMAFFEKYGDLFPSAIQPVKTIIHGDYRSADVARQIKPIGPRTAGILHIDPNTVHGVELSEEFRKVLMPGYITTLVTLGCNAGGLKMLPYSERVKWFDRLKYLLKIMRPHHDACLIQLQRDKSQWAYLLTVPKVWRDRIECLIPKLANEYWVRGLAYSWYSNGEFWKAAESLFLRKDGSEQSPI